jgi:hypothetical protein
VVSGQTLADSVGATSRQARRTGLTRRQESSTRLAWMDSLACKSRPVWLADSTTASVKRTWVCGRCQLMLVIVRGPPVWTTMITMRPKTSASKVTRRWLGVCARCLRTCLCRLNAIVRAETAPWKPANACNSKHTSEMRQPPKLLNHLIFQWLKGEACWQTN